MFLLDGKYEIISERSQGEAQTLFQATAPDGTLVLIIWFALTPEQEARFELYRRAVKRLAQAGHAAVFDVVSRPGAHYVAWHASDAAAAPAADAPLRAALAEHGFTPADADIRLVGRRSVIHGLAWEGQELLVEQPQPLPAEIRSRKRPSAPLPLWFVSNGLAFSLVVLSFLVLFSSFRFHSSNRLVAMPDVNDLGITEAAQLVANLGLQPEALAVPSEQAAGTVIRSDVATGAQLRPGRIVHLAYAFPPGQARPATVPGLKGLRFPDDVEPLLDAAGLRLGHVARIHAGTPAGIVISQGAEPDSTVGEDSEVHLLVSAGPAERLTFLPDLREQPLEEARYLAGLAGLRDDQIELDMLPASGAAAGTVLGQSLLAGQQFRLRDAVLRLNVAAGQPGGEQAELLPSLTGLDVAAVRRALPGRQLEVRTTGTTSLPEGVILQDPPAGSVAPSGVLTVTVNLHPKRTPVPRATVQVRTPQPRLLSYNWFIEPGIGNQTAQVFARTLAGDRILVASHRVRGGDRVEGNWPTTHPGVIHFQLRLNNEPYGEEQLAR